MQGEHLLPSGRPWGGSGCHMAWCPLPPRHQVRLWGPNGALKEITLTCPFHCGPAETRAVPGPRRAVVGAARKHTPSIPRQVDAAAPPPGLDQAGAWLRTPSASPPCLSDPRPLPVAAPSHTLHGKRGCTTVSPPSSPQAPLDEPECTPPP